MSKHFWFMTTQWMKKVLQKIREKQSQRGKRHQRI